VVGEEAKLLDVVDERHRRRGLVREEPQRLEALARREEPVLGLVGPDDANRGADAVDERDDEPVPVPRPRAAAVQLRAVDEDLGREAAPGLVVREQEAALDLELRVEERRDVGERHPRRERLVAERPADGGLRLEPARRRLDELDRHVLEAERVADALAHRLEDLVGVEPLREARRDAQQLLER